MKSSIFFVYFIYFSICSLQQIVAIDAPECDLAKTTQEINVISKKIDEIREMSKDSCEDRGKDSKLADGHDNLSHHIVCRNKEMKEQKLYVEANITSNDLHKGTEIVEHEKYFSHLPGNPCRSEYVGYIVAQEFGGYGEDWNLFTQPTAFNYGLWDTVVERVEKHLMQYQDAIIYNRNLIKKGGDKIDGLAEVKDRHATFEIAFEFDDKTLITRPTKLYYKFDLFTESIHEKSIYGKFKNIDHTYFDLKRCPGTGIREYYFTYVEDEERYAARQTCAVSKEHSRVYGPDF